MISKKRIQKNPNIRTEVAKRKSVASLDADEYDVFEQDIEIDQVISDGGSSGQEQPPLNMTRQQRKQQTATVKMVPKKAAKHSRKMKTSTVMWILVSVATLLMVLGAGWFYLDMLDGENAAYVPLGVTLNGNSLAGKNQEQVTSAIDEIIAGQEATVITLDVAENYVPIVMGDYISTDAETLAAQIMQVRLDRPVWERLYHDYFNGVILAEFETAFMVDTPAIEALSQDVANTYSYPAKDAAIYFEGFTPHVSDPATGFLVDPVNTATEIERAILENLDGNPTTDIYASYTM
ncbi:MAG: hypothetical protein FWD41_05310, partial [Actinomycetia bacterium]|nr:hypothetical protein [Actinomycetes bacterium]